jgi:S-adenosylmethionine/arginine decarboxylase-like enzyme
LNKIDGLHILGDFSGCSFHLKDFSYIDDLKKVIKDNEMNVFGVIHKYFGEEGNSGYTLLIGLEESHISIHTFPEEVENHSVAIDIYTCSISKDNGPGCQNIFKFLEKTFNPSTIILKKEVSRL